jgi:hypothetical protein
VSQITRARDELRVIATELRDTGSVEIADRIDEIIDTCLYRERPIRKASVQSNGVTPYLAKQVLLYALKNPDAPFSQIATVFGVNPGRVSEILNGKRP